LPELVKYMRFKFDRTLLMEMLRFGLPTLPASLSAIVLQIADRPILKAMTNSSEVAMYTVNYRLGIPMMLLVSIFEYAWKPFYLTHYEDEEHERLFSRVLTYFTLFSGIFFLLVGFFMEFLVRMPFIGGKFINPEYWSGMGIIPIILGGYYFNGMFTNFSAGFHIKKKTEYLPLTIGLAAIVNVVMNIVLIPYYGIYGAAWATFVAYLVSAIAAYAQIILGAAIRHAESGLFAHILGAAAVFGCIVTGVVVVLFTVSPKGFLRHAILLLCLVTAQIALGLVTLMVRVPKSAGGQLSAVQVFVPTLHLALGALVLATSLGMALKAYRFLSVPREESALPFAEGALS